MYIFNFGYYEIIGVCSNYLKIQNRDSAISTLADF